MTLNAYLPAWFVMLNTHMSHKYKYDFHAWWNVPTKNFKIFHIFEIWKLILCTKNMAKFEIFSWNHFIKHKSLTILTNCTFSSHLFLKLFLCKEGKFISKDFLRIEHLLIVHFFHKRMIFDPISLQEFHISHLKCLSDRLSDELGL